MKVSCNIIKTRPNWEQHRRQEEEDSENIVKFNNWTKLYSGLNDETICTKKL